MKIFVLSKADNQGEYYILEAFTTYEEALKAQEQLEEHDLSSTFFIDETTLLGE